MEDLISAFDVACMLGYGSTATVIRHARAGKIPGAVFLGHSVRFVPSVVDAFVRSGGEPQSARPAEPRFRIQRHGGRDHSGGPARAPGGMRQVTVDAEYTVKRDSAEGAREPGQGPTGFEPRFLDSGRNVTDDYPWPDTSPSSKP